MKIVITDHPFPTLDLAQAIFRPAGVEVEVLQTREVEKVIAGTQTADVVITGMAPINQRVIDSLQQCKAVIRTGVGYDNVDAAAATARGIMVINIPDFCTEEVADFTAAFLLMIARRVPQGAKSAQEGKWGPPALAQVVDFASWHRLKNQTLGLYAFGRIARGVAERARNGFKMSCIAYDPFISQEAMAAEGVEKVELPELLRRSDYLSLHAPLTKETTNAFGLEQFRAMKRTAWLINTSRGSVIREDDLIKALEEKLIAGAALDVMAKEPPDKNNPLFHRDNVFITPHMASWTWESRDDLQTKAAEEAVRVVKGERPKNLVNPEVLQGKAPRA